MTDGKINGTNLINPGSNGPMITVELVRGKLHGEIVFANPEFASRVLGQHYSTQADYWIRAIKVRAASSKIHVKRVVEFDVPGGWVKVRKLGSKAEVEHVVMPIVANLELTPTVQK